MIPALRILASKYFEQNLHETAWKYLNRAKDLTVQFYNGKNNFETLQNYFTENELIMRKLNLTEEDKVKSLELMQQANDIAITLYGKQSILATQAKLKLGLAKALY